MPKQKLYILTDSAEQDFRIAKRWSLQRWGKALTQQYFSDLHKGAEYIAQNSGASTSKSHLISSTGLGVYPVREHYIVFVPVKNNFIVIVSLIRQTRDVPSILQANSHRLSREVKEALESYAAKNT